ncbi:MAG: hypothetical protein JRN26_01585 [Nitrososphaerota archaeon]|jgi:ribosome-interacting GTPase 1|nr:hypothetical protein [Nitrososphaerota archaeon]MDG6930237.1 hypothetical protein [Nitrososphaerota archaeon]MDG6932639.1 hypothetical protein [Nitrososphaerota archaeon]MDG6935569.1 hypothetical protein [Nitrososphaerota archaeon]MDG6944013.1 hypothetical protein [Nitrososphaerota archaeon]
MVTNLTEESKAIWAKASMAKDPVEKLRLLQMFYSKMPHHKGTEKLEVSLKRQMSNLKEEIEKNRKKKATRKDPWTITKVKFPTLAFVESKTSGVYRLLTGNDPPRYRVFERPFVAPIKALDLDIQLYYALLGSGNEDNFVKIVKQMDALLVSDYERVSVILDDYGIDLVRNRRKLVEIERQPAGGIRIIGNSLLINETELRKFLKEYGMMNSIIKLSEDATMDDVEAVIFGRMQKVAVKATGRPQADLAEALRALSVIRVYTLNSEWAVDGEPLIVRYGINIRGVASKLGINFRQAIVVRNAKRLKVGPSYRLEDGDMVRLISL